MDEVAGILIAVGALLGGLVVLGWACGDFHRPKTASSAPAVPPPPVSPPPAVPTPPELPPPPTI
ncbi:MAG: hypothetical protein HYY91_00250 [Candidatus Omnitrophica bacterium]|nr:hypothetical protein [Candidatus Omnitrophota bacterium]